MLLVIHNLPLNTRFGDVKTLLLEKCGLRNLILDKLIFEDNAMKITVGLPTEEDAALLVRKINGLYLKGHQLYVQDLRQKPSEQPYRPLQPNIQQNESQQNWTNNQQPSWNNQQSWNNNQQSRNNNQQSRNNNQQSRNSNQQSSWNSPVQNQSNDSQRHSNPFLYQQQSQNGQGGYGQDLVAAATMWAQQAQQVNTMYDSQSVHYPQNVQYPQPSQYNQYDSQGYNLGWGQSDQVDQGFEQGGGGYTNTNTSWGESSVPAPPVSSRGRSQETRQFKEPRRARPGRESRNHSRQYSPPRGERMERSQAGSKRRWEESERRDAGDDWRQRPASPPRDFRPHHRSRDRRSPQRPEAQPWTDAPDQRFQPSNSRFDAPKPRFEAPNQKFESKPKFNKKQKFNAPNQKFNAPNQKFNAQNQKFNAPNQKFNAPNQKFNSPNQKSNTFKPQFNPQNSRPNVSNKKIKFNEIPWEQLTVKQQEKISKRHEFNRSRTVTRIIFDIFTDLGMNQDDNDLKLYFTDPVRSRLNKVLEGDDDKFIRLDMMYAKYLDAYNDDKQRILEEAQQLQRDGVQPTLQKLFLKPAFVNRINEGESSNAPQAKRFKANAAQPARAPAPRPAPPQPVPGKIPSYVDGDKKKFKAIKQQHLKDMETLRCPEVGPELDAVVDEELEAMAKIFHKVADNSPDEKQKAFLRERANEECIDDFKKMFKQKICQRLTNEGAKIVRIYSSLGHKPPKKAELEPFMRQFNVLALKKSDRKPFFTAHLDSYDTMDKLCNMGVVKVANCDIIFKPLHMTPKFKRIHMSSLNKLRNKYVMSQIKKPEVNILEKDWEIKLAAIKENEEILKQQNAVQEAAKEEKLKQEKAVQDAAKKETGDKAENANVKPETANVKPENANIKPENANVKPETANEKPENANVKPDNANFAPENDNFDSANDNFEPENVNYGQENPENLNMDVHTDKYGELHANFDVIDEVQGSDTENDPKNYAFDVSTDDMNENETPGKSDESILREMPIGSNPEIIYDEDDEMEGDDGDQAIADDIDLDNIDEDDLEDY